jgi:hypothetical protein
LRLTFQGEVSIVDLKALGHPPADELEQFRRRLSAGKVSRRMASRVDGRSGAVGFARRTSGLGMPTKIRHRANPIKPI